MFEKLTINEFTEILASKSSVPGGGAASSIAGAVGVALGDMVGEFTVGKKKYADVEEDIKDLMKEAQAVRVHFLELAEKDAKAFEPLSKAYGIPKDDPNRDEIMEKCLKDAAEAPLEIFDLACESLDIMKEFADKGAALVLSDAAVGAVLLKGAIEGAAVNVRVNTKIMKDREYAEALNAKVERKRKKYSQIADDIFEQVYSTF